MYSVDLSPQAQRTYFKLREPDITRVDAILEALKSNPRPPGCLKLKGGTGEWRVRVGRFRIVYSIHDDARCVWVVDIEDRKDVYRRPR